MIGAAETGSGKTLAFCLPVLHQLLQEADESLGAEDGAGLRALVITPTRELALQIHSHLHSLCRGTVLRTMSAVGGLSSQKQLRLLKGKPHIVVGTPGR